MNDLVLYFENVCCAWVIHCIDTALWMYFVRVCVNELAEYPEYSNESNTEYMCNHEPD